MTELFEDNNNQEDEDEKIKNISYTITQLNPNDHQKILNLLNSKAKYKKNKEKVNKLIEKINENKKMGDIAKKVKERLILKYNEQQEKNDSLSNYYKNNDKLDKKQLKEYKIKFSNDLFS